MTTLYIEDNTGAEYELVTGISGNYTVYIEPGQPGTWFWVAERYGYERRSSSFTPATGGVILANGDWQVDTSISVMNESTVSALTAISTLDELYDYSVYQRTIDPVNVLITKFGSTLSLVGGINLIVDAASASVWSYNEGTNTLTIKSTALDSGEKFNSITTSGIVTSASGSTVNASYTDSTGSSTNFTITGIADGSSVWVADNNGVTKFFQLNQVGTVTLGLPPGSTGTWNWAVELYGNQRQSNTFEPTGGSITITLKEVFDIGITETDINIVQAYSNINTLDKLYDVIAAYRMTETGIKMGLIATRSGESFSLGGRGLLVDQSAPELITSGSNNLTIRSNSLSNGTRFKLLTCDPPKLIVGDTNEVISANIEDGNGDSSVTISGGSGNFTLWKLPNSTPEDDYTTGVNLGPIGNTKYRFLHDDDSKIVIRDNTTSFRQVLSMQKGTYAAGLYFGDQVQLAQQSEIIEINNTVSAMEVDLTAIKGLNFNSDNNSLVAITTRQNKIIKKLKSILTSIFGLS